MRGTSLARKTPNASAVAALLFFVAATGAAARDDDTPVFFVPVDERPQRSEQVQTAIARYAEASEAPLPPLDEEKLEELLKGEVVRFREKWVLSNEGDKESERTRQRAVAYRLVGSPRKQVWIAALDPHYPANDDLTELRMDEDPSGPVTWYQFFDLPWPIRNRHWVIHMDTGGRIAEATGGLAWEHAWQLVPDAEPQTREWAAAGKLKPLSLDDVEGARYLEANDGAWVMFALDENVTLLAYHVTIVLGGWIPEGMASRFAMRALEDLLDRVASNAERVPSHYIADHKPMYGGDTVVLEPFGSSAPAAP